jgi:hypothetical protein
MVLEQLEAFGNSAQDVSDVMVESNPTGDQVRHNLVSMTGIDVPEDPRGVAFAERLDQMARGNPESLIELITLLSLRAKKQGIQEQRARSFEVLERMLEQSDG